VFIVIDPRVYARVYHEKLWLFIVFARISGECAFQQEPVFPKKSVRYNVFPDYNFMPDGGEILMFFYRYARKRR